MIFLAILVKIALFIFVLWVEPSSILRIDSEMYLRDAEAWIRFFADPALGLQHSLFRTPGYTFFLAVLQSVCGLPLMSIVFLQIVLNLVTALVVHRAALLIDKRMAPWAALIVLLDQPATIFSMMIMTEALHLFFMALFVLAFIHYLKKRSLLWLAGAGLFLALSVYVRPVGYFLGFPVGLAIIYFAGWRRVLAGIGHAVLFFAVTYGVIGLWQYRNFVKTRDARFCHLENATFRSQGFVGSQERETDETLRQMPPVVYYVRAAWRMSTDLMFAAGSMKYFDSAFWRTFGRVFGHLVVAFWVFGFLVFLIRVQKGPAFLFLLLIVLYYLAATVGAMGWNVSPRYRMAMLPALAVLSAAGWVSLLKKSPEGEKSRE